MRLYLARSSAHNMGKWSQYRHRGTVAPGATVLPPAFPLAPPADEDWDLQGNGDDTAAALLFSGTCPVGADGIRASFSLSTNTDPDIGQMVSGACSDALTSLPFSPSDQVNGWLRYLSGGVPVSDWSVVKQVTVP